MDEEDIKWIGDRLRESLPPELLRAMNEAIGEHELKVAERKFAKGTGLGLYILGGPDGHQPVPIDDTLAWARSLEDDKRRVALTSINGWEVSTIFLGIDNNYFSKRPVLFETMIFSETETVTLKLGQKEKKIRKQFGDFQKRYASWDEAVAGHEEAVQMIREGLQ